MKAMFSGALVCLCLSGPALADAPAWRGYAGNPQHTAAAPVKAQTLRHKHWKTKVDLQAQGDFILVHYASPMITASNTVLVAVKTGFSGSFKMEARGGADGKLIWKTNTDFVLAPHDWTPSFPAHLTAQNRLYYAGAGGTVYYRDTPDLSTGATGQLAFYGLDNYNANKAIFNQKVMVDTPITADEAGNIYFGFVVTGTNPLNLKSGIARIGADGQGIWVSAATASGDNNMVEVAQNCAPAISADQSTIYVAVSDGIFGYLLGLDSHGRSGRRRLLWRRGKRQRAQQPRLAAAFQRRPGDHEDARLFRLGRHGFHRADLCGSVLHREFALSADDQVQQLLRRWPKRRWP